MANILRFTVFRLLKNEFVKLSCPCHDLIINPPCITFCQQICQKQNSPICYEKLSEKDSSILYGARQYALALPENIAWGCILPQSLQGSTD